MNKRLPLFFALLIVLFTGSTLLATELPLLKASHLQSSIQTATAEKYPDADDIYIEQYTRTKYKADGTSQTWSDTAIKVLTEKGKRDNRSLTLRYNISYGTSKFVHAQIIKPDGSLVPIDIEAQSKEMIDSSQMNANIYNPNSKRLTLSVPGLEIGDTLLYGTHEVQTKTVVPNTWSDYQVFEHREPSRYTTYQVIAPKELPLKKIILKDEIPDTVTFEELTDEATGEITYTWSISEIPGMFDEPNMPEAYTVVQRLLVSTIEKWEDLSKWYWDLCLPRLEATTPEMIEMAHELVEGRTHTLDKINAIFNFVSQDIRYMGITTEEEAPGYEPHDVSITFENRYGVCRDKAALLAAMLRIVDIEAFPVIIMSGPKKDEEVPQPFFNHAVTAALGDNGEYILMDSTDENTKDIFPSYLQNMSYIVARPEGETLLTSPLIPASENLLKITTTGSLNEEGSLEASSTLLFEGINDTAYRGHFSKIKPEERKRFFEGHLKKNIPTAEVLSVEILPEQLRDTTQPLSVHLKYTASNLLITGEKNKLLELPRLGSSLGFANFLLGQTGLNERKYPLYTRMTAGISETLSLNIPENTGSLNIPAYQNIDTPQLTWDMQLALNDSTLHATNTFLINTVEFSPEEYLVLKQQLKDIEYNQQKKLILDTPELNRYTDQADTRIIEHDTQITLTDASNWTRTVKVKKEIQTYAGTKSGSEITLNYNPAWQEVKLISATVTQTNGTVQTISPEEINIMEAPWVSSAPRYPAEKILVANLPGVKVGSVLEYEIELINKDKPFFSMLNTFIGHEPMDSKTLSITVPKSLSFTHSNDGITQHIQTNETSYTYHWEATNVPALKKEEQLPPVWSYNPSLFISTRSWKSYATTVLSTLNTAANKQKKAKSMAKDLTDKVKGDIQKVRVLHDWVAQNVQEVGPAFPYLPLSSISSADQTLNDRYGNNADRMVLLHSMLRAKDIQSEFVLSGSSYQIPEALQPLLNTPLRTLFTTVLLKVTADGKTVYLDARSHYSHLGTSSYDQQAMLNLSSGEISTLHVSPKNENKQQRSIQMTLDTTGTMDIEATSTIMGTNFESFHQLYKEITPEKRRRHYLELVAGISQSAKATSELTTQFDSYPGKHSFKVSAPQYAVCDGSYIYFDLPQGDPLLKYQANTRSLPLAWSGPIQSTSEYTIALPEGYEPIMMPNNFSWHAPKQAGSIEVVVKYNPTTHTIHMVKKADLKAALIPATQFSSLIEAGRKLIHPSMRTILLQKK